MEGSAGTFGRASAAYSRFVTPFSFLCGHAWPAACSWSSSEKKEWACSGLTRATQASMRPEEQPPKLESDWPAATTSPSGATVMAWTESRPSSPNWAVQAVAPSKASSLAIQASLLPAMGLSKSPYVWPPT